jgi:hypothetical protein
MSSPKNSLQNLCLQNLLKLVSNLKQYRLGNLGGY